MTLHKLSAGTGYEYLTNQVAAVDSTELGRTKLADYYSAKGEAPGRWTGSGLAGVDGIEAGDVVTADQMKHLFGTGSHPVMGKPLGRAFRVYGTEGVDGFNAEVARRIDSLEDPTLADRARIRSGVATEWFVRRHDRQPGSERELSAAVARYSRPRQTSVSGFDLTFSPVKSVSALWAIAPPEVAKELAAAHHAAVADALAFLEKHAIFTREGTNGVRQVETRGLIAAAFTHRDSRAGDPDLHTHVAVANKVQTRQGKWLSIYGTVLHEHVVATSETYNTALEQHLSERLGVRFAARSTPGEQRPVREVAGVDRALCAHWSRRRKEIVAREGELAAEFTAAQGRPPTSVEAVALAQQANLETREAKHDLRSEAEQRATWATEADDVLGSREAVTAMIRVALNPSTRQYDDVSAAWITSTATSVIAELESHRATWQMWHVLAEVQRQIRGVAIPTDDATQLVDLIMDAVEDASINLTPEADPTAEPHVLRRSDGASVYRHSGADHFTSPRILKAERRLRQAGALTSELGIDPLDAELALLTAEATGLRLNRGQRELVMSLATTLKRLRVAIAPAGSGKTTTMTVLAQVWSDTGHNAVGLAPSAAAAAVLREASGMPTETLAKLDQLAAGDATGFAEHIGDGTLVVIDVAGMADTPTLDRVVAFCLKRGATVRLVGDDRQLAAVGAGGVLRDLATAYGADRLDEVVRFVDPVEAAASLDLRDGNAKALGFYLDHDRVHVGATSTCVGETLVAWSTAHEQGRDCLMLAPTRHLVGELNARARAARLGNDTAGSEVALRDGNHASVGDIILTRLNARTLRTSGTDWVKNGDRWAVARIRDGAVEARHVSSGLSVVLPAQYVAAHVDLGYASTVHGAQGVTADVMHGIVTGTEDRQLLYTMLTRGRLENHVHVIADAVADLDEPTLPGLVEQVTATETLEAVLARDGAAVSATATAARAVDPSKQLQDSVRRYADALTRATHAVVGADAGDARETADGGPLPWLRGVPVDLAGHETWGAYLTAQAERIRDLAAQVKERGEISAALDRVSGLLPSRMRDDVLVWRAANGVADDDHRLLGPRVDDPGGHSYARRLQRQIDESYPPSVRRWEARVVEVVGRHDDQTVDLAQYLDGLHRDGRNPAQLLARAIRRGPLPDDHACEALAYRVQRLVTRSRRVSEPTVRREPTRPQHGIGL